MTEQLAVDFLLFATLESKGILTEPEAQRLSYLAVNTTPLSYDAAKMAIDDALSELDSWDTCEVCRRVMYDWRQNLSFHHNAGHPTIQQPPDNQPPPSDEPIVFNDSEDDIQSEFPDAG